MERTNWRMRKMLNAPPPQRYGRISGQNVLDMLKNFVHMMYSGMSVTMVGSSMEPTHSVNRKFRRRKRRRAKA